MNENGNGCEMENSRLRRLYERLDRLQERADSVEPGTQDSRNLNMEIEQITRSIESMEAAAAAQASKKESEARKKEIGGSQKLDFVKTISAVAGVAAGALTPIVVERIRQKGDLRKVDRVTRYEDDGNIIKTQAMKFVK